jgi:hypothetical protein
VEEHKQMPDPIFLNKSAALSAKKCFQKYFRVVVPTKDALTSGGAA